MKQTIHIPARTRAGRTTVAIYCYPYDKATGKTRTRYVGSLRVDTDPDTVSADSEVPPGARLVGITVSPNAPFSLGPEQLSAIKSWLVKHGTFLQNRDAAEALREQEHARLKEQLQREVREELAHEQLAARQALRERTVGLALVEAEAAILRACDDLMVEAQAAFEAGNRLTHRRSLNTDVRGDMPVLDVLQARANRVRVTAVNRLEHVCQTVGLMVRPERRRGVASSTHP